MIKYKANFSLIRIEKKEIISETVNFFRFSNNSKEAKLSTYHIYTDSFKMAKEELINHTKDKIKYYQKQVKYHEDILEKIEKMNEELN